MMHLLCLNLPPPTQYKAIPRILIPPASVYKETVLPSKNHIKIVQKIYEKFLKKIVRFCVVCSHHQADFQVFPPPTFYSVTPRRNSINPIAFPRLCHTISQHTPSVSVSLYRQQPSSKHCALFYVALIDVD